MNAETPKRYYRVTIDGASCICATRAEVDDLLDGGDGATITEVFMTASEYEKLPDFEGF